MIGYAKYFDSNIIISFKVIDKNLLKKYTIIIIIIIIISWRNKNAKCYSSNI